MPKHEIHRRPDEGADEIPQRDVERRLQPARDGDQELRGRDGADGEDRDLGEERELARLKAVVLAEQERDQRRGRGQVPDPGQQHVPLRPGHAHAAKARDQVVAFADEEGGEGAEDDAVDVNRPQPAEGQLEAAAKIVGEVEQARQQHARPTARPGARTCPSRATSAPLASRPARRGRRQRTCLAGVCPSPPRRAPIAR